MKINCIWFFYFRFFIPASHFIFLGPLVFQNRHKGSFVLAGIVSFGLPCYEATGELLTNEEYDFYDDATTKASVAQSRKYGIYTAVPQFVEWIKNNSNYLNSTISELNFVFIKMQPEV